MLRRTLYVLLALLVVLTGVPFLQQPAVSAGEVIDSHFTMKDVQVRTDKPVYDPDIGDYVLQGIPINAPNYRADIDNFYYVIYNWQLDNGHGYSDGATYTFKLPDEFDIPNSMSGDLDGEIGTYEVKTDGTVTFTFNGSIDGGQGYEGYFYVWVQFDEKEFEDDGLVQKIVLWETPQISITVHFQNEAQDGLVKSGKANNNGRNSSEIEWQIDFNQGENTIEDAVLTDKIPDGLTLIPGSVKFKELYVKLDGKVGETGNEMEESDYAVSVQPGNLLQIEFDQPLNKPYRFIYKTEVAAPTSGSFDINYTNLATLTGNGYAPQTDTATVNVKFNEPLKKMADTSKANSGYDDVNQTVYWKTEYNYNQQFIDQADAWIVDTFDTAKFEVNYADIVVYEVKLNEAGERIGYERQLAMNTDYTVTNFVDGGDHKGFKIQFGGDVDRKAYDIFYNLVRKADERVYTAETVTNKAEIHGGISKEASKDIHQVIFAKSVSGEDFANKEIRWKLDINRDKKEMTDIEIVEDYLGMHMTLIPGSFEVYENGSKVNGLDPWLPFTLEPLAGDPEYEEGFKLKLSGPTTSTYTIGFKTKFDPTAGMPPGNKYTNIATISWLEDGVAQTPIVAQASVTPQSYTIDNGNKTGAYNAQTKTITWTIDVNYNLYDIQDFILEDTLTSTDGNYMEIIPESVKIYNLTLHQQNNQISKGSEWVDGVDWDRETDLDVDNVNHKLTLKLGHVYKALRIEYQTKLADEVNSDYKISGSYKNEAILKDGMPGSPIFQKQAPVTPAHGGEYLSKTGNQAGQTDVAEWTITINASQSHIAAPAVLTDELSDNHILLPDTIKLYQVQVPPDNSESLPQGPEQDLNSGDYELEVNGDTFTLTFHKDLTTAYLLKYKTYINADHGQSISNTVKLNGISVSQSSWDESKSVLVNLAGAGGGSSAGKEKIKIVKRDDENNPLQGVVFELWNQTGTVLLETLVTDANGEAETKWLYKYNAAGFPYTLKEVSVPSGYLKAPDYGSAGGKVIHFQGSGFPIEITNAILRQGFELVKRDKADPAVLLAGAEYVLYDENDVPVATLTTDADGRIAMGGMEPKGTTIWRKRKRRSFIIWTRPRFISQLRPIRRLSSSLPTTMSGARMASCSSPKSTLTTTRPLQMWSLNCAMKRTTW